MKMFSMEQLLTLHEDVINLFGGTYVVRDTGLLEPALAMPFVTFGGEEIYPTPEEKAARIGFLLIRNHGFLDGNKRIGAHAMLCFCEMNGIRLKFRDEELIGIVVSVAAGLASAEDLLDWVRRHRV